MCDVGGAAEHEPEIEDAGMEEPMLDEEGNPIEEEPQEDPFAAVNGKEDDPEPIA